MVTTRSNSRMPSPVSTPRSWKSHRQFTPVCNVLTGTFLGQDVNNTVVSDIRRSSVRQRQQKFYSYTRSGKVYNKEFINNSAW